MAARARSGYSSLVRWLKVLLPLMAVALIAAIFLSPQGGSGSLPPAEVARLAAGLQVENPVFKGTTDDGEPFEVTATVAVPDGPMANEIALEDPVGLVVSNDNGLVTARADRGVFGRIDDTLILEGSVRIMTEDGYSFETERARLMIRERSLQAPGPVKASGPMGLIEAGSFRAEDTGTGASRNPGDGAVENARIWFENGVRVVIIPETSD